MSNLLLSLAFVVLSSGAVAAAVLAPCTDLGPCGTVAEVASTDTVWSGGSDTGSLIPILDYTQPTPATCTLTSCVVDGLSHQAEAFVRADPRCLDEDDFPCTPKDVVVEPHESVAMIDEDGVEDRWWGSIRRRSPPPPVPRVTIACYSDGRMDSREQGWDQFIDERRCYDVFGDPVSADHFGPCFDRWGNFLGIKSSFHGQALR